VVDVYRLRHGVRTVGVSATGGLLLNGMPTYLHGFGKHEDAELRGRGLDLPTLIKDWELLGWAHANSIRTSHYPYADEAMALCDERGIMVIDEAPAVGLQSANMVRETLARHMDAISEMITRDRNHASVIAWSIANEPDSEASAAAAYFKHVAAHTRGLDPSRR